MCTVTAVFTLLFKMISAEHSSNNGKNKVTKKTLWHCNILNTENLQDLKGHCHAVWQLEKR